MFSVILYFNNFHLPSLTSQKVKVAVPVRSLALFTISVVFVSFFAKWSPPPAQKDCTKITRTQRSQTKKTPNIWRKEAKTVFDLLWIDLQSMNAE